MNRRFAQRTRDRGGAWLAGVLVAAGFVARLRGYFDFWPNPDEGAYYAIALSETWRELFAELTHHTHPPGIYVIHHLLAGISDQIAWLRMPSLVGGTLAIYGAFLAGRQVAGVRAGLVAASILAFSPAAIGLSQTLRPYGVAMCVLIFGVAALLRHARERDAASRVRAALLLGAALLMHYATLLVLPGAALVLMGTAAQAENENGQGEGPAALARSAGVVLSWSALAAALWLGHIQPHLAGDAIQRGAQQGWLAPYLHQSFSGLAAGFLGVHGLVFGDALSGFGTAAFLAGTLGLARSRAWPALVLSFATLGCAAVASWLGQYPFGETRHSFYLAAVLAPVWASAIGTLGRADRVAATAAVMLVIGLAFGATGLRDRLATVVPSDPPLGERVARNDSMAGALAALDAVRSERALLVLDRQTYRFLSPYFGRAGTAGERTRSDVALFTSFDWGRARVVVAHAWMLRTKRSEVDRADHVFGFLRRASSVPELALASYREGLLVLGGWHLGRAEVFARVEAGEGPRGAVAASRASRSKGPEGLVSTRVDWAAYVRALQPIALRERAAIGESPPSAPGTATGDARVEPGT